MALEHLYRALAFALVQAPLIAVGIFRATRPRQAQASAPGVTASAA